MTEETSSIAWDELQEFLVSGERLEGIVFGAWGWGVWEDTTQEPAYGEPDPPPVPFNKRNVLLTPEEAEPFMRSWSFYSGFGAPDTYAIYAWTNFRTIWVTQYDGSSASIRTSRGTLRGRRR